MVSRVRLPFQPGNERPVKILEHDTGRDIIRQCLWLQSSQTAQFSAEIRELSQGIPEKTVCLPRSETDAEVVIAERDRARGSARGSAIDAATGASADPEHDIDTAIREDWMSRILILAREPVVTDAGPKNWNGQLRLRIGL